MRLSVRSGDPGYHPRASLVRVFLSGSERSNVLTADEEKRWALLHRLDEDGRPIFVKGEPSTEEFWGDVRIELPPGGLPSCGGVCVDS
jgi:hypothetical protein